MYIPCNELFKTYFVLPPKTKPVVLLVPISLLNPSSVMCSSICLPIIFCHRKFYKRRGISKFPIHREDFDKSMINQYI